MKKTIKLIWLPILLFLLGSALIAAALFLFTRPEEKTETPQSLIGRDPLEVVGQDDPVDTISQEGVKPDPIRSRITLSFAGDVMLASERGMTGFATFNSAADENDPSFFLSGVYDIFSADDWTIVNCENVFTDLPLAETQKDYTPAYWYKSPTKNAGILSAGSVEIASVANNHMEDYGWEGARDTRAALEAAGVKWGDLSHPMILEKDGIKIALLLTDMYSEWYAQTILKWLESVRDTTDFQIIYYHGGTERVYQPESWRVRSCRMLIDAGADLVIGSHPHVLQPIEFYGDGLIVYSLGNFIFGGSTRSENRTIIFQVTLDVSDETITETRYNIIPCYEYTTVLNNWQPVIMEPDDPAYEKIMNFLAGNADSPK